MPSDKIDLFDGVEANSPPLQGVTIRVVIRLAAPPPPRLFPTLPGGPGFVTWSLFVVEMLLKLVAYGWQYFYRWGPALQRMC